MGVQLRPGTHRRTFAAPRGPLAAQALAPPRVQFLQQHVASYSDWTFSRVQSALQQHEAGQFASGSQLIDAMGRDPRIVGPLSSRTQSLIAKSTVGFDLVPPTDAAGKVHPRHARIAEAVESWWFDAVPDAVQVKILHDGIMGGVAYGPIRWEAVDGQWIPRIELWSPQHLWWSESAQRYMCHTRSGIVPVIPGIGEWFLAEPFGERSWMRGAVRFLGLPFLMHTQTFRDWARYCEEHGLPTYLVKEPPGAASDQAGAATFYSSLRTAGRKKLIRAPQQSETLGWDVQLLESSAREWESFQQLLRALDAGISIGLLGQNLSSEVQGGSYAAAQSHMSVRQDYLDGDAETMATALRDQLIGAWGIFNEPGWDTRADAPWPTWTMGLDKDRTERATTMASAANALVNMVSVGVPVDVKAYAEEFHIPLQQGKEDTELTPAAGGALQGSASGVAGAIGQAGHVDCASGFQARADSGLVQGQDYTERVRDETQRQAAEIFAADIDTIMSALDGAKTFVDAKSRLEKLYSKLDETELGELVERAMLMASLAGSGAVLEDVPEADDGSDD